MNDLLGSVGQRVCRSVFHVLLIGGLSLVPSCQSMNPLPGFGVVKKAPEENRIRELLKWHSGRVEVYKDFQTVFSARAVFISDEIRRSVVDWEAKTRLMNPDEKKNFYRETFKGGENSFEVLLGFYTPEAELNDLEKEDSGWIAYLEGLDGKVVKASCSRVDGKEGKIYMRFLEWDLSWSRLYLLRFPKGSLDNFQQDGWVKLVISGPAGQGGIPLRSLEPRQ